MALNLTGPSEEDIYKRISKAEPTTDLLFKTIDHNLTHLIVKVLNDPKVDVNIKASWIRIINGLKLLVNL